MMPCRIQPKKKNDRASFIERHGEGIAALVSGLFMLCAWLMEGYSGSWAAALYLISYGVGGFVKAREGLIALVTQRKLDVNMLMMLAAIGAASIGYWMEGAILIFIFSLSGALESYAESRSRRDLSSLMKMRPEKALRIQDGEEKMVSIEELRVGDRVLVKPGEQIPADSVVIQGASAVNEASITGESLPADKVIGDEVFAGTLNGRGSLLLEVNRLSEESLFSKIVSLVEKAQQQKPKSQHRVERFEQYYANGVILTTLLLMVLPPLLLNWSWSESLYKAMVFIVVASPCAVVASIMPAVLSAMSNGARKGLLFKGGSYLQALSEIKAVAFDKTGTLTVGEPVVTDVVAAKGYSEAEVLQVAASLESLSEHPIAEAVLKKAKQQELEVITPDQFEAVTGKGVQAQLRGEKWKLGKAAFLTADHSPSSEWMETFYRLEDEGKTVVWLGNDRGICGMIALQDTLRPQAKDAIAQLKQAGIHVVMLTGDQKKTAEAIAAEAGIDHVRADLLPEGKVAVIQELEQQYGPLLMVGEGVNDAPALISATVGMAMGVAGSDVSLDVAQVVLMKDDLDKVPIALKLAKKTRRIVKQNLIFAAAVIFSLIVANFIGGITLPLGVIGHEGSTILVILNGLRLLR